MLPIAIALLLTVAAIAAQFAVDVRHASKTALLASDVHIWN